MVVFSICFNPWIEIIEVERETSADLVRCRIDLDHLMLSEASKVSLSRAIEGDSNQYRSQPTKALVNTKL
jgi:hypothetical protein